VIMDRAIHAVFFALKTLQTTAPSLLTIVA